MMNSITKKFECITCKAKFKTGYELMIHGRSQHIFPGTSRLQDDHSSDE